MPKLVGTHDWWHDMNDSLSPGPHTMLPSSNKQLPLWKWDIFQRSARKKDKIPFFVAFLLVRSSEIWLDDDLFKTFSLHFRTCFLKRFRNVHRNEDEIPRTPDNVAVKKAHFPSRKRLPAPTSGPHSTPWACADPATLSGVRGYSACDAKKVNKMFY